MIVCEYGCGQEGKYPPKKGRTKWCCHNDYRKCPGFISKVRNKNKGKIRSNEAKQNSSKGRKGIPNKKPIKLENNQNICEFGCGQKARYYFSISKKYCCSDHSSKCPNERKKRSKRLQGHVITHKTRKKIGNKIKLLNQTNVEYKIKQSISRTYTAEDYKIKYPFFTKIEEIRNDPITGTIQVHCKNHNCPNSKEEGGWFTPTNIQLYERIRQLEKDYGQGGCYLYCSNECKNECPLFNVHSDPCKNTDKPYTDIEYQTFRKFVLERDDYKCQYCGNPAEHVHHERPQKLEPFFALDPDLAWSCCKECHYKYGHKDECSTGNLAAKIC